MKYIQKIIFLIFFVLSINKGNACECIIINNVDKEFETADYVFSGRVSQIEYVQIQNNKKGKTNILTFKSLQEFDMYRGQVLVKITFSSLEIFKGGKRKKELVVYTRNSSGGNCGFFFRPNKEYIIYAFKDSWETEDLRELKTKYKKSLYTDTCTRTKIIDQKEIEKIKVIKHNNALQH